MLLCNQITVANAHNKLQNQTHKSFEMKVMRNLHTHTHGRTHNRAFFIYFTLSQGELGVTAMDSVSYAFHLAGLMLTDIAGSSNSKDDDEQEEEEE